MKNWIIILTILALLSCRENDRKIESTIDTLTSDSGLEIQHSNKNEKNLNIDKAIVSLNNPNLYNIKLYNDYLEKEFDTLVDLAYLEDDLMGFQRFNYPELKRNLKGDSLLTLYNDSITVIIEKSTFDSSLHNIGYNHKVSKNYVEYIDGEDMWGTDGNLPNSELKSLNVTINKKSVDVPKKEIKNLFSPNLMCYSSINHCYTKAYVKDNELIIHMENSDGAGAYTVIWFIKNGKYKQRIIGIPF